jgi:hypothetical protein
MASVQREIVVEASPEACWDAIRDIGALHTRLVPGFVVDCRLEPGGRVVTFGNGVTIREPIVAIDEAACRLVWSAEGSRTTHYNAAVQVTAHDGGAKIAWTADLLPDSLRDEIAGAMDIGMAVMKKTLNRLAD